jgi:hypothetical protein
LITIKDALRDRRIVQTMDAANVIVEVRWNSRRNRYDVVRDGVIIFFHGMKGGAMTSARRIAHDLTVEGQTVEIIVVESDGSRSKDGS